MLLHKQSELWHLHFSSASSGASGWKWGQWFSSVDLEGHERDSSYVIWTDYILCVCVWWIVLSRYFIMWHWHHIWPFPSDVRLYCGRLWKIETAAMQPVDWASVICIGGLMKEDKHTSGAVQLFSTDGGKRRPPPAFTGNIVMRFYWQQHLAT